MCRRPRLSAAALTWSFSQDGSFTLRYAEQRVVGMLALKRDEATLDQIFVLPAEQGKGVGAALMRSAKQAMPTGFTLRMAASNDRARRFYEKEGLRWLREGVHPWTGILVHFYGWNVR